MTEHTPSTDEIRERFIDGFPFDTWVVARVAEGAAFDAWLNQHESEIRRDQIEKDAAIAERTFPLGSLVLGDAPTKIAAAIRAQSTAPAPEVTGESDEKLRKELRRTLIRAEREWPGNLERRLDEVLAVLREHIDPAPEVTVEDVARVLDPAIYPHINRLTGDGWQAARDGAEALLARFEFTERKEQ